MKSKRPPATKQATRSTSLETQVGLALRHIQDLALLNRSPLGRLVYVERVARDRFRGHLMPRGRALRAILESCIDQVISDLSGELTLKRQCEYLRLAKEGVTCKEISRSLALSREHVARKFRKQALALVAEEFRRTTRGG